MENVKIANKIYIISGEFNLCLSLYATNICPHIMITVVTDKLIKTLNKSTFFINVLNSNLEEITNLNYE